MAHKKGAGSSDNGRDSISKRLGVKMFGGQLAKAGNIIVRQRGTKFHAGQNVYMGRDHTLHAQIDGVIVFRKSTNNRRYVSVLPADAVAIAPPAKKAAAPKVKVAKPAVAPKAPKVEAPKEVAPPIQTVDGVDLELVAAGISEAEFTETTTVVETVQVTADVVREETGSTISADEAVENFVADHAEETVVVETVQTTPDAAREEIVETVQTTADAAVEETGSTISADEAVVSLTTDQAEETAVEATTEEVAEVRHATPDASVKAPKQDDLKIIEGIGPKIEQLLHDGGITTWLELSLTPVSRLQEILDAAGPRYQVHNPSTWPAQAKFAHEGKFDELKEYQDMLTGGRDLTE